MSEHGISHERDLIAYGVVAIAKVLSEWTKKGYVGTAATNRAWGMLDDELDKFEKLSAKLGGNRDAFPS